MKIMKDQILGNYTVRKKRECKFGYYTKRIRVQKRRQCYPYFKIEWDLEIKKSKPNFWDSLPKISEEEKEARD